MHLFKLWVLIFTTLAAPAFATPAAIVILRHAEKPVAGNELSTQGFARARLIAELFKNNPEISALGPVYSIFAANPLDASGSLRPIQTVTPLALSLKLRIDTRFDKLHSSELANEVLNSPVYNQKVVVICWVSAELIHLIRDFGITSGPVEWPSQSFNRIILLRFNPNTTAQLEDLPQNLLPADSHSVPVFP